MKVDVVSQKKVHRIKKSGEPFCCPTNESSLWDAHPRVYLPLEETGRVICPYCSAEYILDSE